MADSTDEIIKNPEAIKAELEGLLKTENISGVTVPDVPPKGNRPGQTGRQRHKINPPGMKHMPPVVPGPSTHGLAEENPARDHSETIPIAISDTTSVVLPSDRSVRSISGSTVSGKGKGKAVGSPDKRLTDLEEVVHELGLKIQDLSEALDRAMARIARLEEIPQVPDDVPRGMLPASPVKPRDPHAFIHVSGEKPPAKLNWERFLRSTPYPGNPRVAAAQLKSWAINQGVKVVIPARLDKTQYNIEYLSTL